MPSVNASEAGGSIRLPARVRTGPDRWLHGSLANHGDLSCDFEEIFFLLHNSSKVTCIFQDHKKSHSVNKKNRKFRDLLYTNLLYLKLDKH